MLPKNWWTNPKLIELYIEKAEKQSKRFKSFDSIWRGKIEDFKKAGLPEDKAISASAKFFLMHIIRNESVPKHLKWNGRDNDYDMDCNCCQMFVKAGVIETPGKLRYLGNYPVGYDSVCKELLDENGETYFADVKFMNYLDMYRCEVCGNEWTEGY